MTGRQLKNWVQNNNLSNEQAWRLLGIPRRTLYYYYNLDQVVNGPLILAIKAIDLLPETKKQKIIAKSQFIPHSLTK